MENFLYLKDIITSVLQKLKFFFWFFVFIIFCSANCALGNGCRQAFLFFLCIFIYSTTSHSILFDVSEAL